MLITKKQKATGIPVAIMSSNNMMKITNISHHSIDEPLFIAAFNLQENRLDAFYP
jgi:hypothetical protein